MRGEMFDSDPSDTRSLAAQATALLDERMKRWPEPKPPVAFEELSLAVGLAEMNAGNADEARAHFEASLARNETTRALVQLGQLDAKLGQREEALALLRRALEQTSRRDVNQTRMRAQIIEQIGDVQRGLGKLEEARASYVEALLLWDASVRANEDASQRAFAQIRRGVLLSRLDRQSEALQAFELAMQAASDNRETYAQILAHLTQSVPEPDLADTILGRAQRQLTLEPEWRAYFALWVQLIYARAEQPVPGDVQKLLERLSQSDAWWGHLSRYGAGKIDYAALRKLASGRGERTEADFYEGARRLGVDDLNGARRHVPEGRRLAHGGVLRVPDGAGAAPAGRQSAAAQTCVAARRRAQRPALGHARAGALETLAARPRLQRVERGDHFGWRLHQLDQHPFTAER